MQEHSEIGLNFHNLLENKQCVVRNENPVVYAIFDFPKKSRTLKFIHFTFLKWIHHSIKVQSFKMIWIRFAHYNAQYIVIKIINAVNECEFLWIRHCTPCNQCQFLYLMPLLEFPNHGKNRRKATIDLFIIFINYKFESVD